MDDLQPEPSEQSKRPGKLRTVWHPLLVRMLDHVLGPAFTVREEVSVGKMPLRVDILLVRREGGQVSEAHRRELSALLPLLNRFTLIEFKGPTDALERGDFGQLVGCSFLWHSQESDPILHEEVSLIVLAPTVGNALREELRLLGLEISEHMTGIFQITGLPFTTWLMETDVMAERGQPVIAMVSRLFLRERKRIMDKLENADERLVSYIAQQIHQFRSQEDIALHYTDTEHLEELEEDLRDKILEWIPADDRLRGLSAEERVRGLPAEERVRGLPAEERVRGLPAEERVRGLPAEERLRGLPAEERVRGLPASEILRARPPEEFAAELSDEDAAKLREALDRKHPRE